MSDDNKEANFLNIDVISSDENNEEYDSNLDADNRILKFNKAAKTHNIIPNRSSLIQIEEIHPDKSPLATDRTVVQDYYYDAKADPKQTKLVQQKEGNFDLHFNISKKT